MGGGYLFSGFEETKYIGTLGCVGVDILVFWIRGDETAHLLYMSDLEDKTIERVYLTGVVQMELIIYFPPSGRRARKGGDGGGGYLFFGFGETRHSGTLGWVGY